MSKLIPQNNDNNQKKSNRPGWFNVDKLKKAAQSEVDKNNQINIVLPEKNKQIIISHICDSCKLSFADANLTLQKKQAAREGNTYLQCPQCGGVLRVDKTAMIAKEKYTGVNTRDVYRLKPGRMPNSFVDKAVYGHIVHEFEKFCNTLKMDGLKLRFQRGIRANSDGISGPKTAEFSIEWFDESNTRNRIFANVSITPTGKLIPPTTFRLASGREYPFTRAALTEVEGNKLYDMVEPYVPMPHVVYKQPDMTRWPFAWSKNINKMHRMSSKKMAEEVRNMVQQGLMYYKSQGMDPMQAEQKIADDLQNMGITPTTQDLVKDVSEEAYGQEGFQTALSMKLIPENTKIADYVRIVKVANYPNTEKELFENTEVKETFNKVSEQKRAIKKNTLIKTYNYVLAMKHSKDIALKTALAALRYSAIRPEIYDIVMTAMESGESFDEATMKVRNLGMQLTPEEWNEAADTLLERTQVVAAYGDEDKGGLYQPTGNPTPFNAGMQVTYQGNKYIVKGQRNDGVVILSSPEFGQVYVPLVKQNEIQYTPPTYSVGAIDLNMKKEALRDSDSYIPLVESDPEYSLSEQTQQSEAKFDVPYSEMDQGVLPDDKRNYLKMFRGSLNLKQKVQARLSLKRTYITHNDGEYVVHAESGKELGKHKTKEEATKQLQAIEINKHKEGKTNVYQNKEDHNHPYKPETKEFPKPDTKEVEEFDKKHPKHAAIEKTAEPTGYEKQDGKKDTGWPVGYDRVKDMLQSLVRQNRTPIPGLDLHALKDNKYTRAELIGFLDDLKAGGKDSFTPPATASNTSMTKFAKDEDFQKGLNEAIEDEIAGQDEYQKLIEMVNDPLVMEILQDIKKDEAKHEGDLKEIKTIEEKPKEEIPAPKDEDKSEGDSKLEG